MKALVVLILYVTLSCPVLHLLLLFEAAAMRCHTARKHVARSREPRVNRDRCFDPESVCLYHTRLVAKEGSTDSLSLPEIQLRCRIACSRLEIRSRLRRLTAVVFVNTPPWHVWGAAKQIFFIISRLGKEHKQHTVPTVYVSVSTRVLCNGNTPSRGSVSSR